MFRRLGGFAVSHPLAWKLTFGIGSLFYEREMAEAESLWLDRAQNPDVFQSERQRPPIRHEILDAAA